VSGSVGAQVDSVLAAAEQAATGIREEARDWARQHKEEARQRAEELAAGRLHELSSLTEDLRSRAKAVAKGCDQLIKAIEAASGRRPPSESGVKLRVASSESQEADEMPVTAGLSNPASHEEAPISDRARLSAAQMIAAGSSRAEISQRLREEFGIQDAGAMLDRMGA
jgi:hypothetical protein